MEEVKKRQPKEVVTEAYLKIRERKKWQMALRRYVIERIPSDNYAPYFGLDAATFRQWIELQFTDESLNWESFGKAWQFDHIVPVVYFDFSVEEELKLCWNFINIRVEPLQLNKNRGNRIDVMAVRPYFEDLYAKTNYHFCTKMLDKISRLEVSNIQSHPLIENFIIQKKQHLENIASLTHAEFNRFNQGIPLDDILLERALLKKFG